MKFLWAAGALAILAGCQGKPRAAWNTDTVPLTALKSDIPADLLVTAVPIDDSWKVLSKVNSGPWDEALFPAADRISNQIFYLPTPAESKLLDQGLDLKREDLSAFKDLSFRSTIGMPEPEASPYEAARKYTALANQVRTIFVIERLNAASLLAQKKDVEAARVCASILRASRILCESVNSRGLEEALTPLRNENVRSAIMFAASPRLGEGALRTLLAEMPKGINHGFERSVKAAISLEIAPLLCRPDNVTGYGPTLKENPDRDAWVILDHSHPRPLDRRKTVKLICSYMARILADAAKPWTARDRKLPSEMSALCVDFPGPLISAEQSPLSVEDAAKFEKSCAKMDNPRGRQFAASILMAYPSALRREVQMRSLEEMLRMIVALKIYEKKHKALPASLGVLVAENLLTEEPKDLVDGKPLRYSRELRRLWSIGADEKDDGGKGEVGRWFRGDDWILSIP